MKHVNSDRTITYRKILGQNIRKFRLKKNISQRLLADEYGIPRSLLSRIERGESDLHLSSTLSICAALGIPYSKLIIETEKLLPEDYIIIDW